MIARVGKSARKNSNSAGSASQNNIDESAQNDGGPIMGARKMRFAELEEEAISFSPMPNIDGLNRQIVEMLQEDGRAAYSAIAKKLNVSEATVRSRVSRMRESNLIHFITVVNPVTLGYTAWAMLGIKVANGASAHKVAQYFRDCPEVVYAMRVASQFDLLAEIVCETPNELRDFLDTHCYGQKDVASVEPMIGLGLYKSLFKWEQSVLEGSGGKRAS